MNPTDWMLVAFCLFTLFFLGSMARLAIRKKISWDTAILMGWLIPALLFIAFSGLYIEEIRRDYKQQWIRENPGAKPRFDE